MRTKKGQGDKYKRFDFSKLEFITDKKEPANLQEIIDVENEFELTTILP